MVQFKESNEDNLVVLLEKHKNFAWAMWQLIDLSVGTILFPQTTKHIVLFLCLKILSTACTGTIDRHTGTLWP
jgi:hypothetical protein